MRIHRIGRRRWRFGLRLVELGGGKAHKRPERIAFIRDVVRMAERASFGRFVAGVRRRCVVFAPPSRNAPRSAHCPAAPAPRAALVPGRVRPAVPCRTPCPSRSPARRARPALVPGSARPVASHPRLAAPRAAPRRACTRQLSSPPRTLRRPAHHRAPRRAAPRRPAPVSLTRFEFAQINSNFPYLVKFFLDDTRFTSYLSQLHFFADSRILLKEERPRGPRKNR